MTPKEASLIEFEEPDWRAEFERETVQVLVAHPKYSRDLAQSAAFERVLSHYRRFHWTPVANPVDGKDKLPLGMSAGVIGLAKLGIMPPRNTIKDVPRDGKCYPGEQHDAHCWLIISQRAWKIVGVEDKMLCLDSFGDTKQIDLGRAKWDNYVESAVEFIHAGWPAKTT